MEPRLASPRSRVNGHFTFMSDLLSHPLWQADSLGSALPDDEFGVSVSLPLWRHVIGY